MRGQRVSSLFFFLSSVLLSGPAWSADGPAGAPAQAGPVSLQVALIAVIPAILGGLTGLLATLLRQGQLKKQLQDAQAELKEARERQKKVEQELIRTSEGLDQKLGRDPRALLQAFIEATSAAPEDFRRRVRETLLDESSIRIIQRMGGFIDEPSLGQKVRPLLSEGEVLEMIARNGHFLTQSSLREILRDYVNASDLKAGIADLNTGIERAKTDVLDRIFRLSQVSATDQASKMFRRDPES